MQPGLLDFPTSVGFTLKSGMRKHRTCVVQNFCRNDMRINEQITIVTHRITTPPHLESIGRTKPKLPTIHDDIMNRLPTHSHIARQSSYDDDLTVVSSPIRKELEAEILAETREVSWPDLSRKSALKSTSAEYQS